MLANSLPFHFPCGSFPCELGNLLKASGREGQGRDRDPWDLELTGKFQIEEQLEQRHGQDQESEGLWFHQAGASGKG